MIGAVVAGFGDVETEAQGIHALAKSGWHLFRTFFRLKSPGILFFVERAIRRARGATTTLQPNQVEVLSQDERTLHYKVSGKSF